MTLGASGEFTDQPTTGTSDKHHGWKILSAWVIASVIVDPLFWFYVGPHLPPGSGTTTASGASFDTNVLSVMAIPVVLGIWIYAAYAIVVWRRPKGEPIEDGPPLRGNRAIQTTWLVSTTLIVLIVFVFGTVRFVSGGGAGSAGGSDSAWTPHSKNALVVQVIGQQWEWTYRYPSFGGFETSDLVLPVDTTIAFHVTSLDVIHSFWAYQLGVKADADPDFDNVAYTTTLKDMSFVVRCSELCGLWHGAMFDYGKVVPKSTFEAWATSTESKSAVLTATLPTFSYTYTPSADPCAAYAEEGTRYLPAGAPKIYDPFSKEEIAPYKPKVSGCN
jgi:cytochrome c oxidase subunit 2